MHHSDDIKIKLITMIKQRKVLLAKSTASQSERTPLVEPRQAKPKTNHQAPTLSLKLYDVVIESEARTTAVQLKSEA